MTDIETAVNLDQLKLLCALHTELQNLFVENTEIVEFQNQAAVTKTFTVEEFDVDVAKDSGVDFEMSSVNSINVVKKLILFSKFLLEV